MRLILTILSCGLLFAGEPLVDAAKSGNKAALKSLIEKKTDANKAEPDGTTALHWAAYRDDLESADLLLRAGAKANAITDLGATPLWLGAQNGSAVVVKRLLDAGANPNLALESGETPLMVASRGGYAAVAESLLSKGANPDAHGTRGQTALMWAVSQQHPEVVKVLIAHKANLHVKSDTWSEVMAVPPHGYRPYNITVPHGAETALMFAARVGDLASAKLLLAAGANPNDADAWGISALTLAEHSGFTDVALLLLDKGADPNQAPNGFTALHEAIMRRDEKLVAALLDHKADANFPVKQWTPTRRSSDDYHFEPSMVGASPLWLAARFNQPRVMKLLLAHGADPKFVHNADYTVEAGFAAAQRKETVNILGAAVGMLRMSPWVETPKSERDALVSEAVKLAVDNGEDLSLLNTDGHTPLDAAKTLGIKSVVDYLTAKGAKPGTAPAQGQGRGRGAR